MFPSSGEEDRHILRWAPYELTSSDPVAEVSSKRHNRVGVSLPSLENGNRFRFRNAVFSSY
jgi:hypothetical protein